MERAGERGRSGYTLYLLPPSWQTLPPTPPSACGCPQIPTPPFAQPNRRFFPLQPQKIPRGSFSSIKWTYIHTHPPSIPSCPSKESCHPVHSPSHLSSPNHSNAGHTKPTIGHNRPAIGHNRPPIGHKTDTPSDQTPNPKHSKTTRIAERIDSQNPTTTPAAVRSPMKIGHPPTTQLARLPIEPDAKQTNNDQSRPT